MDGVADVSVVVTEVIVVGSVDGELVVAVVSVAVVGADVGSGVDVGVDVACAVGAGVQAATDVSEFVGCASAAVSSDVAVTLPPVIRPPAAVSDSCSVVAQPETSVTTTARTENQRLTIQS